MSATDQLPLLPSLPSELLDLILALLSRPDLKALQSVSKWGYAKATSLLWQEVSLVDCRREHEDAVDEHCDAPLVKLLLVLVRRPDLAACVQTLTHRCRLPPPSIFQELPRMPFSSHTLSTDTRTIGLVRLAARNLTKLSTLRIILGHPSLNDALLRCLFDKHRRKHNPVRRLWLENCRISAGCDPLLSLHILNLPVELDFDGLESIRLRRLPLRPAHSWSAKWSHLLFVHARPSGSQGPGMTTSLQDGQGSLYSTTVQTLDQEQEVGQRHLIWLAAQRPGADAQQATQSIVSPLSQMFMYANLFEQRMYDSLLPHLSVVEQELLRSLEPPEGTNRSELAYRGSDLDPTCPTNSQETTTLGPSKWQRERLPSAEVAVRMLQSAARTLTSLTLDWVFTMPAKLGYSRDVLAQRSWVKTFLSLFSLRFPHLRAFQFRNAVVIDTVLPRGLCLLDHSRIGFGNGQEYDLEPSQRERVDLVCLQFMEAHQNLECLAWPMDHFFSERGVASDIATRVEAVISNLGRTLKDLRIDHLYSGSGEPQTQITSSPDSDPRALIRRRRFITEFAPKMTKVESIKIEGGIARDERREVIRALHGSPLRKLVMIGVSCPLGNTWGPGGSDLSEPLDFDEVEGLEAEDKESIWALGLQTPKVRGGEGFKFEAEFGWPKGEPMLNIIASFHAETIRELKFCGYKGAPSLLAPTPITTPLLGALKHFHNLESLIMSFWLSTIWEGASRDYEVMNYWLDTRPQNPSSPHNNISRPRTAVAPAALVNTSTELTGWGRQLRMNYAPDALAEKITGFLGPLLSERAKRRRGGVHIRASFCLGELGGIFDVDLWIGQREGAGDVCLGYKGPREELEEGRRRGKEEGRRWF